ncbi:crotonase/enoyl-CoA hydratase family protein [Nonomuraea sp. NEAU-A123]|uniref:crotonase/enoyl-CoA hydratase family protein n=1 Tax=Nonomuraea sp. NEAU-A123 TaxID=2839649 RepID=UPI001BE4A71B|nr:crotonase/enoyl-CoA hydratase family protein [Nonomuraea sp. NEAU-A123]MBT2231955.1 crotonase/enoyl-CoA hydratase family protein [Nonomuraea sp. NEAU-A123]
MGEPAALVERRDHIVLITLNRPEVRNAVNADLTRAVGEALDAADADASVRAVVLTGAGDKAFCAGADLKEVARGEFSTEGIKPHWGFAGCVTHPIAKPVIAAVNGFALGGGTEIALWADLVVAAETAAFGLPEVKRGIIAGAGGTFRLAAQLPAKAAMEILLTGEPVSAADALRLGLINRVVPPDQVVPTALALAETISANAPLSVQASKRIARGISDGAIPSERAGWERTAAETAAIMRSADAKEGPRAFAEKRAPVWEGR